MKKELAALTAMLIALNPALAQTPLLEEIPESVTPSETGQDAAAGDEADPDGFRVVDGDPAPKGTVPWQIQIFWPNAKYSLKDIEEDKELPDGHADKLYLGRRLQHELEHICGGSYIGGGWILTAAHCVPTETIRLRGGRTDTIFNQRRVRMGTQNIIAGGAIYQLERVVVHKDYSSVTQTNDIALIKVRENGQTAGLGGRLKAITPHSGAKPIYPNDDVWVTGWGWTEPRKPEVGNRAGTAARQGVGGVIQRNPPDLQQAKLKHIGDAKCKQYYRNWGPGMLCVGSANTGKDSCQGDSGGPLVWQQGREMVLVGIVSQGKGCAFFDTPAAYTRVSYYSKWIKDAQRDAPTGFSKYPRTR
jgi:secreted trypsin-like serine protease